MSVRIGSLRALLRLTPPAVDVFGPRYHEALSYEVGLHTHPALSAVAGVGDSLGNVALLDVSAVKPPVDGVPDGARPFE